MIRMLKAQTTSKVNEDPEIFVQINKDAEMAIMQDGKKILININVKG